MLAVFFPMRIIEFVCRRIGPAALVAATASAQVQYIALDQTSTQTRFNVLASDGYRLFGTQRAPNTPTQLGYLGPDGFVVLAQTDLSPAFLSIVVSDDGKSMLFSGSGVTDSAGNPLPEDPNRLVHDYWWSEAMGFRLLPGSVPAPGGGACGPLTLHWYQMSGDGTQFFGHGSPSGLPGCPAQSLIPYQMSLGGTPAPACWWPAVPGLAGPVNFDGSKVVVDVPNGLNSRFTYHVDQCTPALITGGFVSSLSNTSNSNAAAISSRGDLVALSGPDGLMTWTPQGGGVLRDSTFLDVAIHQVTDEAIYLNGKTWTAGAGLQSSIEYLMDQDEQPIGDPSSWMVTANDRVARGFAVTGGVVSSYVVAVHGGPQPGFIGDSFCGIPEANSSGLWANINGVGSAVLADDDLRMRVTHLPQNQVGIVLSSRGIGLSQVPGSEGALCIGGGQFIGRLNRPGELGFSGAAGEFSVEIDTTILPGPIATISAQAGETWYFQAWYRDVNGGQSTSNFTDAVSITFE